MIRKYVAFLLVLFLVLPCCGCVRSDETNHMSNNYKASEDDPEQWMEDTVNALMTDNPDTLKRMFAASLQETDEFDSQIQSLFSCFDGDIESYDIVPGRTYISTHDGIMESEVGCDIYTTNASYRLAIKIRLTDKRDSSNEGIQSLYVVNTDDLAPDVGYWGSIVWTPGITISKESSSI